MSTIAEISAAIIASGYRDIGNYTCKCGSLKNAGAILAGVPASMSKCQSCLESILGAPLETIIQRMTTPRQYPTIGRITEDDPSIYGSELLGHEGDTWESFNRRHKPKISTRVAEPFRRGIGQGFGSTEDGDI